MHTNPQDGSIGWKTIATALGLGTIAVLVVVTMLGSQVSGILSTVGASVGNPSYQDQQGEPNDDPGSADGGTDSNSNGSGSGSGGSGSGTSGGSGGSAGSGGSGSGVVLAVPRDNPLVIKTGSITIQVADVSAAVTAATGQVSALGGYASGSKRSGKNDGVQATVTFRIPSAQWDAALNGVRSTGEVQIEETSTDDVTTKVVDLGARIRNLQVTEQALQSIMDKAGTIKDVLSVQDQLTDIRGQIEQLTAEKAHLEEQAAFSTLTATFQLKPAPAVVVAQTTGFDASKEADAATAKLIRGLQKLARAGIWFGIVWLPILLTMAIALAVAFFISRRVHRWWIGSRPVEVGEGIR
ncbi:MAG TPA: DUF4349 domain-containing protein [Candidatus Limnocylindrales bacterium]|nr:DUF4349 domain-containing protein [Candidatus Limnocylindrales bacterium]